MGFVAYTGGEPAATCTIVSSDSNGTTTLTVSIRTILRKRSCTEGDIGKVFALFATLKLILNS